MGIIQKRNFEVKAHFPTFPILLRRLLQGTYAMDLRIALIE
jgi:hypothetical protein